MISTIRSSGWRSTSGIFRKWFIVPVSALGAIGAADAPVAGSTPA